MLDLSSVTLILFNGVGDLWGTTLLKRLATKIRFGEVFHISPADLNCPGVWIPIPEIFGYWNSTLMSARLIGEIGSLPWVMTIELDGFPIHPELWDNTFFEWDYIGAPWPASWPWAAEGRVGNGGCSFRSRRFIKAMRKVRAPKYGECADTYWCCDPDIRKSVEADGCRYAPVDVAIRFSFETTIEEYPNWTHDKSFAFHKTIPNYRQLP